MQLYYLSVFVFVLCSVVAAQQECGAQNLTTPFIGTPICTLSYTLAYPQGKDSTPGNELYNFFVNFTALAPRVNRTCAEAYAAYYCNQLYPECVQANSSVPGVVKPACIDTCLAVLNACDGYKNEIATLNSTQFPYPSPTTCTSLSNDPSVCSVPAVTDLSPFYCEQPVESKFVAAQTSTNIICDVNYSVIAVITGNSYTLADDVWETFSSFDQHVPGIPDTGVNDSYKDCFQSFSNFYCSLAFPQCPADGNPASVQRMCQQACYQVISDCDQFSDGFDLVNKSYGGLAIPTPSYCATFPTTNCFMPINNDTNLEFFFSGSGFFPTPSPEPTDAPSGVVYPPGGPGKGAGLGVGVLIILLLIIGAIMLIMKKQDSR